MTPIFQNQPDENRELSPSVHGYLSRRNFSVVVVDGIFDLLVLRNKPERDKYVELKVCLASQRRSIQISSKQWKFLDGIDEKSPLNGSLRYFIYDHKIEKYAICGPAHIKAHRQANPPTSTSYIQRKNLDSLVWLEPVAAYESLVSWLTDGL